MVEKRAARRARWASVREGSSCLLLLDSFFGGSEEDVDSGEEEEEEEDGFVASLVEEVDSDSVVLELSDSEAAGVSVLDLVLVSSLADSAIGSGSFCAEGGGGMRMTFGEDSVSLLSALFSVSLGCWVEKKRRPSRIERRSVPWRMPHIEGFIGLRGNWERERPDDNAPPVPLQEEGRTASRIAVEEDIVYVI